MHVSLPCWDMLGTCFCVAGRTWTWLGVMWIWSRSRRVYSYSPVPLSTVLHPCLHSHCSYTHTHWSPTSSASYPEFTLLFSKGRLGPPNLYPPLFPPLKSPSLSYMCPELSASPSSSDPTFFQYRRLFFGKRPNSPPTSALLQKIRHCLNTRLLICYLLSLL